MRRLFVFLVFFEILAFNAWGIDQSPVTRSGAKATATEKVDLSKPNEMPLDKVFFVATASIEDGYKRLTTVVNSLMGMIILIDLVGMFLFIAMSQESIRTGVLQRLLTYGIWIPLLLVFPSFMGVVRWLFVELGQIAGGGATQSYGGRVVSGPTTVFLSALSYASPAWHVFESPPKVDLGPFKQVLPNFGVQFVGLIAYIMVMIPMMKIVIQYFVTYIKFSVIMGVGAIFIPWAIWKPTRFISEKFLSSVYAHGVELMIFGFLLNIGQAMFDAVIVPKTFSDNTFDITILIALVVVAFLFSTIVSLAPSLARDLSSGTLSSTDLKTILTDAMNTATMGAAGAVAMAGTGAATVAGGVGGVKGGKDGSLVGRTLGAVTGSGLALTRSLGKVFSGVVKGAASVATGGEFNPGGNQKRNGQRSDGGTGIGRGENATDGKPLDAVLDGAKSLGPESKGTPLTSEGKPGEGPAAGEKGSVGGTADAGTNKKEVPASPLAKMIARAVTERMANSSIMQEVAKSYRLGETGGKVTGYMSSKVSKIATSYDSARDAFREIKTDYKTLANSLKSSLGRGSTAPSSGTKNLRGED